MIFVTIAVREAIKIAAFADFLFSLTTLLINLFTNQRVLQINVRKENINAGESKKKKTAEFVEEREKKGEQVLARIETIKGNKTELKA